MMQSQDIPYDAYVATRYFAVLSICAAGPWRIDSAYEAGKWLLLVVNDHTRSVLRCEYDNFDERYADIEWLKRLPPTGGESAAVGARLKPTPPSRVASAAKTVPKPDDPEDDAPHG